MTRCWELRDNRTAYDGAISHWLSCLGATLVATDARLSRASDIMRAVEVLRRTDQ